MEMSRVDRINNWVQPILWNVSTDPAALSLVRFVVLISGSESFLAVQR